MLQALDDGEFKIAIDRRGSALLQGSIGLFEASSSALAKKLRIL
jgi:hypothetical protein